jgi:hypothetical protein
MAPPPVAQSEPALPSMAPAPAAPSAAPLPPAASLRAAPQRMAEWQRWTQVRIDDGTSAVLLPRSQAASLPELLEGVLRAPPDAAPAGAATVRLQLLEGGQDLGTLEAVEGEWRWTPAPGAPAPAAVRGLRAAPALAAALLAEAERLLRR